VREEVPLSLVIDGDGINFGCSPKGSVEEAAAVNLTGFLPIKSLQKQPGSSHQSSFRLKYTHPPKAVRQPGRRRGGETPAMHDLGIRPVI
jgi:hypothetical protein